MGTVHATGRLPAFHPDPSLIEDLERRGALGAIFVERPKPPEPAWMGATRDLTEDELLDPSLFVRSSYERYL